MVCVSLVWLARVTVYSTYENNLSIHPLFIHSLVIQLLSSLSPSMFSTCGLTGLLGTLHLLFSTIVELETFTGLLGGLETFTGILVDWRPSLDFLVDCSGDLHWTSWWIAVETFSGLLVGLETFTGFLGGLETIAGFLGDSSTTNTVLAFFLMFIFLYFLFILYIYFLKIMFLI